MMEDKEMDSDSPQTLAFPCFSVMREEMMEHPELGKILVEREASTHATLKLAVQAAKEILGVDPLHRYVVRNADRQAIWPSWKAPMEAWFKDKSDEYQQQVSLAVVPIGVSFQDWLNETYAVEMQEWKAKMQEPPP